MPRNWFIPFTVVPMNLPLSSATIGDALNAGRVTESVEAAAQIATSDVRRKIIKARENN